MTLHLYGGGRSRAVMPKWYMAEKQIDYNLIISTCAAGAEQRLPENQPVRKTSRPIDDSNGAAIRKRTFSYC